MNDALLKALALMRSGQWAQAHDLVQQHDTPEAAWLHALLHLQEGDLANAEYWYGQAGRSFGQRLGLDEELAAVERRLRGEAGRD